MASKLSRQQQKQGHRQRTGKATAFKFSGLFLPNNSQKRYGKDCGCQDVAHIAKKKSTALIGNLRVATTQMNRFPAFKGPKKVSPGGNTQKTEKTRFTLQNPRGCVKSLLQFCDRQRSTNQKRTRKKLIKAYCHRSR